ncbi:unnamed protein product [Musa acuminata subsp. malaccensis]|uniref:(wild Malaysian banana) hypothetical protein n=1 Tax=Musa acuminata subsp. malaccensis TaxID=214687 RepID=A0A804HNY6_MUSAM|nr:unnamed protein product [Musa acuminata subsp. malaccensis]
MPPTTETPSSRNKCSAAKPRTPVNKDRAPSFLLQRPPTASNSKERATKSEPSSSKGNMSLKPSSVKASETPAVGKAGLPLGKAIGHPKTTSERRETLAATSMITAVNPQGGGEKVIGNEAQDRTKVSMDEESRGARRRTKSPKPIMLMIRIREAKLKLQPESESRGEGDEAVAEEKPKFKEREERAVTERKAKAEQKNVASERKATLSGRKDSPSAYNDVNEEAAHKLASRRNKVTALAGDFETIVSLQKPEAKSSQPEQ